MSKPTPGPWMAYLEHEGGPLIVGAGTHCTVALMYQPPAGDKAANASLIAAAPLMLEALEKARDYLSCIPESAAGGDDDAVRLCREIEAAIRAARGEA